MTIIGCSWKKWNIGKSVQVEELEDMYVKKKFGVYMLNPKDVLLVTKNIFLAPTTCDVEASKGCWKFCMLGVL